MHNLFNRLSKEVQILNVKAGIVLYNFQDEEDIHRALSEFSEYAEAGLLIVDPSGMDFKLSKTMLDKDTMISHGAKDILTVVQESWEDVKKSTLTNDLRLLFDATGILENIFLTPPPENGFQLWSDEVVNIQRYGTMIETGETKIYSAIKLSYVLLSKLEKV